MKKQKIALSKLSLKKDTVIGDLNAVKGGSSTALTFCGGQCAPLPASAGSQCCGPQVPRASQVQLCSQPLMSCDSTPERCGQSWVPGECLSH